MVDFGNIKAEQRAIETTYTDFAEVLRTERETDRSGITHDKTVTVLSSVRCALSRGQNTSMQGNAQFVNHDAVLFVPPGTDIRAGDTVDVMRHSVLRRFLVIGNPNDYATHREVKLEERTLT